MTTALLAASLAVEVLLLVIVAGLLRSHADVLTRLRAIDSALADDRTAATTRGAAVPPPSAEARPEREDNEIAPDLVGETLRGEPVIIGLGPGSPNTLIAFLSSGCLTCETFWDDLRLDHLPDLPDLRVVAVTKGRHEESPSRLKDLIPTHRPTLMSSETWSAYKTPVSPYFVYVDGRSGTIAGEGSAGTWAQVISLLKDALADEELLADGKRIEKQRFRGGSLRTARVDAELAAGGIVPDHPSLYAPVPPGES